jgi:hypothetical protein
MWCTQHPWSKEVYHDNAYLNYLSWKAALQKAFGDKYNLVFTKGDIDSDLRKDNFYTYGTEREEMLGGEFTTLRETIQMVKQEGLDKIIIAPCHWFFDGYESLYVSREAYGLPLQSYEELEAGIYHKTHCEDLDNNTVDCDSGEAVAEITQAESYSNFTKEFATAYYVVLRGTLERFGLYPDNASITSETSQMVTKLDGGIVKVTSTSSLLKGARIVIPGDPYPDRPENFTKQTAIAINDPKDTNDCMWEDTVINIGYQTNPPAMEGAQPVGPAVHFGPYRTFFNRDVTVTIPFDPTLADQRGVKAYIYNHITEDWGALEVTSRFNGLITFKTQVLGLFMAGFDPDNIGDEVSTCPVTSLLGENTASLDTVRLFRDKVLAYNAVGRKLIDGYYKNGARINTTLDKNLTFKKSAQKLLELMVPVMENIAK